MSSKKNIWKKVLTNLEAVISKSDIDTWLLKTELSKFDDSIAIIEVQNKFIATWIRDNFHENICESIEKISGKKPEVLYNYNKNINKNQKKVINYKNKNIKININKSMTFSNFFTGECNRFAYSSSAAVADKPGENYNPFFIFSKYGIGKTHLLNAIGNRINDSNKSLNIGYVNSKDFILDFGYLSKNKNFSSFKNRYIKLDVLLFDDIQFLSKSKRLQEEFIFIFDHFQLKKKQIVVTGDRSPVNLNKFNSHLKSRLSSGLIAEIDEVDQATKLKIIKGYIKNKNIHIQDDIVNFLIKSNSDIKTIFKNIVRIETYLSLNKGKLNLSLVKSIIKDRYEVNTGIEDIKSVIAGYFNISVSDLISKKKKADYSYPRHLAMYMARNLTDLSLNEIGYLFGDRDHSTVIYAVNRVEKTLKQDEEIRKDINNIKNLLT